MSSQPRSRSVRASTRSGPSASPISGAAAPTPAATRSAAAAAALELDRRRWSRRAGRFPLPRTREAVAALGLAVTIAASVAFALSAATGSVFLVPAGAERFPDWLRGPLPDLGAPLPIPVDVLFFALVGVGWGIVMGSRASLGRGTLVVVVSLQLLFTVAPPVFSTDAFGYLAFGRLGAIHDLNPYSHPVEAVGGDPALTYLSSVWPTDVTSPYGPLFTLFTLAVAPLGLGAGLWALKALTGAAALGSLALVAAMARRLDVDPVRAVAFVGLNPLWLVWALGGAHNDLPMVLLALAGMQLVISGRERWAGAAAVAAFAVKATAGIFGLFLLAGARRRWRFVLGAVLGAVALTGLLLALLGTEVLRYPATLAAQGAHESNHNVPGHVATLLGTGELSSAAKLAIVAGFGTVCAGLLLAVRRGLAWITAAGWATIAFLLTTTSLHTWYIAGLLPLAALSGSRRLQVATAAMTVVLVIVQLT